MHRELLDGAVEGLANLVVLEDGLVELLGLLVPEAVEQRGVGEALDILDEVVVLEHDVVVAETLLANVLERGLDLVENHVLILVASLGEASLLLSLALGLSLVVSNLLLGERLGLELAEFGGGDHGC